MLSCFYDSRLRLTHLVCNPEIPSRTPLTPDEIKAELHTLADIGSGVIDFVCSKMQQVDNRKQNTIWHAGMELRVRADAVNWNLFKFLTAG